LLYGIVPRPPARPTHGKGPGDLVPIWSPNQETRRRGIVLSFASAMMQSLVAVGDVSGFACFGPQCPANRQRHVRAERVIKIAELTP